MTNDVNEWISPLPVNSPFPPLAEQDLMDLFYQVIVSSILNESLCHNFTAMSAIHISHLAIKVRRPKKRLSALTVL